MTNAFEYGDALLPEAEQSHIGEDGEPTSPPPIPTNQPYLNLATYAFLSILSCLR